MYSLYLEFLHILLTSNYSVSMQLRYSLKYIVQWYTPLAVTGVDIIEMYVRVVNNIA